MTSLSELMQALEDVIVELDAVWAGMGMVKRNRHAAKAEELLNNVKSKGLEEW